MIFVKKTHTSFFLEFCFYIYVLLNIFIIIKKYQNFLQSISPLSIRNS